LTIDTGGAGVGPGWGKEGEADACLREFWIGLKPYVVYGGLNS